MRSVSPCTTRSAATRATAGPHIIPWPPGEATSGPDRAPVGVEAGADDRQVIGRVVDRRDPDPAQAEVARDRDELAEPRPHAS